ncbi:MAG: hypothetical protein ACKOXB_03360 [Flavobacteriales bacterium]
MKSIKWNRTHYEDLGEQDAKGLYEYAYTYNIYSFVLPDGMIMEFRNYDDSPNKFSLLRIFDGSEKELPITHEFIYATKSLASIINFLIEAHNAKKIDYFDSMYIEINLNQISIGLPNSYEFIEQAKKS